jgi:HEAT repeat protein
MHHCRGSCLLCLVAILPAGCLDPVTRSDIQSADAGKRILAIKAAGEARDRSAVPLLVDRLDDEDDAVRLFAILALERITGTRMGYDFAAPTAQRVAAIERWRRAVNDGDFARATTQPESAEPASAAADAGPTKASR